MPRTDWTESERLIAERAVLLNREVMAAMQGAPHGHGLEVTEAAVMQGGQELLRLLLFHPQVEIGQVTSESHAGEYVYHPLGSCQRPGLGVDGRPGRHGGYGHRPHRGITRARPAWN